MKNFFKIIFLTTIFTVLLFGSTVFANSINDYENDPQAGRAQGYGVEREKDTNTGIRSLSLLNIEKTISPYTGSTYTHNSIFDGVNLVNGVDVSSWNADIDWEKVAADGIEYAIIRVGYRTYGSGEVCIDQCFEKNIEGALDAGIKVGVYFFTQAITKEEALEEADFVLSCINGYDIEMPVVIDFEYASNSSGNLTGRLYKANLSVAKATDICEAFSDRVELSGYTAMIYSNKSTFTYNLDASVLEAKYQIWLANYVTETTYNGKYNFWQYSEKGKVDGINGNVDCDFWYDDESISNVRVLSTSITLNTTEKTLLVGKAYTLKAALLPEDTTDKVSFSSSKPYVAYVTSDGYVKAVSKGTTTITVTSTSGLTKKCKVIVNENLTKYEIADISNCAYTGKAIKPSVTVQSISKVAASAKTTTALRMRSGPGTSYSELTTIPSGQKINILGSVTISDATWYAVSTTVSGVKYKGYCYGSYLNITKTYKTLTEGKDYQVQYANNIKIGKATVTVTGLESGTTVGALKKNFKICPKQVTALKKVSVTKNSVKIQWAKKSGTGYEIYRKTGKSGKYKLVKTIKKNSTVAYKNTGLKKNTTYYYKVRAYKTVNDKKYYGSFSKTIKVTTKSK